MFFVSAVPLMAVGAMLLVGVILFAMLMRR